MLALSSSANAAEAKPADHTYVTIGEVQPIHHRQGAVRVKADCKAGDTPVSVKAATPYGRHVHTIATGLKLDKGRRWAKVQIGHGFALVRADVTCKVAPHGRWSPPPPRRSSKPRRSRQAPTRWAPGPA